MTHYNEIVKCVNLHDKAANAFYRIALLTTEIMNSKDEDENVKRRNMIGSIASQMDSRFRGEL